MFLPVPFSSSSSGPERKGLCSLPVSRDNASVLSYLCSQHLTGLSSVGFGKPSAIVLQLQHYKENKRHHSLLPPDPGLAASRQQPRASVFAVLFRMWRESRRPLLRSGLKDAASPDFQCMGTLMFAVASAGLCSPASTGACFT